MNRNGVLQHLDSEQLCHIILEKDDAEALLLWASKYVHCSDFVGAQQYCQGSQLLTLLM